MTHWKQMPAAAGRILTSPAAALAVVAAVFSVKLVVATSLGLDGDEAYYTLWSAHLAPGYLDHPPGIALAIALGRLVAGDGLLGVRLFALVASLLTSAALYRTARLLFPDTSIPAVAVIWYSLCILTASNLVATPDAPSTLFWALTVWAVAECRASARPGWWLAVGLFAGLGLVSKYTNAFLGPGLLLFLLASPAGRAEFRRWQLWAGGALAIAVVSPVLWWNAAHDWASFLFQGQRVAFKGLDAGGSATLELLVGQALLVGPVLLISSMAGAAAFLLRPRAGGRAALALPVLTSLPLLGYFLVHSFHSRVEANWTQPALPAMTLVAVWAVLSLRSRFRAINWVSLLARVLHPLSGGLLVAIIFVQALFHPFALGGFDRTAGLRDWDGLYREVRELATQAGAARIWTAGDYRLTGELFTYGLFAGDAWPVRDISMHRRYEFLPAIDAATLQGPALFVASVRKPEDTQPPLDLFKSARLERVVQRVQGNEVLGSYAVFVVGEPVKGVSASP